MADSLITFGTGSLKVNEDNELYTVGGGGGGGDASAANQTTLNTLTGAVTETAPVSDTASSGLNGRLQRIAQRLTSLIALLPSSLGQKAMSGSLAVTLASDQTVVSVITASGLIDFTLSLDTSAYSSGDLLADTQSVSGVARANDATFVIQSLVLNDKDDQGVAMRIYFLSANNSMGTENSAPSITDANADAILGFVDIFASDWIDVGGSRQVTKTNIGIIGKPASGTTTLYIAMVNGTSTPTFTASGITGKLGVLRD